MSANWKPGDRVTAYYPGDPAPRDGEILPGSYSPVAYRVRFENGAIKTLHWNYLYAPGEPITRRPEAWGKDKPPGRSRKAGEAKAPRQRKPAKRGLTGKRRQQVRDILRLAMEQRLATSTTPKRWKETD